MRLWRLVCISIFLGAHSTICAEEAVSPTEARLLEIPRWDGEAGVVKQCKEPCFVFFDADKQEYVIRFAKSVKTGEARDHDVITFRFQPQFAVVPRIDVKQSRKSDGSFSFDYSVSNETTAKDAIRIFAIVASVGDTSLKADHSTWRSSPPVVTRAVAPQAALFPLHLVRSSAAMGVFLQWDGFDHPIEPGRQGGVFHLSSSYLPGPTTAYVATGRALRTPYELPIPVMDQITPLLAPERNYRVLPAIGPRFPPGTAPKVIAKDFLVAIEQWKAYGWLLSDSAVVRMIQRYLNERLAANEQGGARIDIPKTSSRLEQELMAAINLSLPSR